MNNDTYISTSAGPSNSSSAGNFYDDMDGYGNGFHTRDHSTVTRYQAPAKVHQEALQAPPFQSTRVSTGALRMTAGGEVQAVNQRGDSGPASYATSFAGTTGGSVVATLQRMGMERTVELIPGNPASRTLVASALRDGLIEDDGRGGYRDVGEATPLGATTQGKAVGAARPAGATPAPSVPQEAPEAAPEPLHEAFSPSEVGLWNKGIESMPQAAYDAAVARTMGAVLNGGAGNMDSALSQVAVALAQNAGIDQDKAAEFIKHGSAMYQSTVERALEKVGLVGNEDTQGFYKWLRQSQQGEMHKALQHLVLKHDPSAFVRLGVKFQGWKANRL